YAFDLRNPEGVRVCEVPAVGLKTAAGRRSGRQPRRIRGLAAQVMPPTHALRPIVARGLAGWPRSRPSDPPPFAGARAISRASGDRSLARRSQLRSGAMPSVLHEVLRELFAKRPNLLAPLREERLSLPSADLVALDSEQTDPRMKQL